MDAIISAAAYLGAALGIVGLFLLIVAIAFAERGPAVEDDQFTPEVPYMPPALIADLSFWDRQERRALTAEDIEHGRQMWEAYKVRMDAIRKAETGEI